MSTARSLPVSRKLGEQMRISAKPADTDLSFMREKWDFCLKLRGGAVTHVSREMHVLCQLIPVHIKPRGRAQEVHLLQNCVIHSQSSQTV